MSVCSCRGTTEEDWSPSNGRGGQRHTGVSHSLTHSLTHSLSHSLPPLSPSNRYKQLFDIEGESGVVVRGIGTCVGLIPKPPSLSVPVPVCFPANVEAVRPASTQGDRSVPVMCMLIILHKLHV